MGTRTTIALVIALFFALGFTGVNALLHSEEPRDLKAEFALAGVDDVSAEALAALEVDTDGLECTSGFAGPYPCSNVDLLGLVPLADMAGVAGNDSWGWTDPETGNEYAIMGTGRSTAFVDVTDPTAPQVMGTVGQAGGELTGLGGIVWRDIKVDQDHAFIVTERGGGMQIVDLTQLRDITVPGPQNILASTSYTAQGANSFHNIGINTDTDRAYLVGGNFKGGLHIVDIADPTNPAFIGAFPVDGYTHDVQCVLYEGPDDDYNANAIDGQHEICFASNEDTVTVVDVTDPTAPELLTKVRYDSASYTHQGWLTPDHRFFVFNDELDESGNDVPATTTYMVELPDLDGTYGDDAVQRYEHSTRSVDHNLYIRGDLIFEANYNAGLRVLRYTPEGLRTGDLEEVGYFDVDPALDINQYGGAWNVYPFFESGTIIVSSIDEGLYVLEFTGE